MSDGAPTRADAAGLDLPPGYRAIALREYKDAMAHAKAIAATDGAGTLVFVRRFDTVEFAVVLEPEEPLGEARRAIYAIMNAVADALAAHVAPEKPVTFDWPDTIRIDGGIIGGATLAWPEGASETEPPHWLVAGAILRSVVPLSGGARNPYDMVAMAGTSLDIEGIGMLDPTALIEGFSRHLMVYVDRWQEFGFPPVGRTYLDRLTSDPARRLTIAGNGDLIERGLDRPETIARHDLTAALATPKWRDPATGEPWL